MNILPKKRWHVRTRENIARVRRDEAAAEKEEKERLQRVLLAERETRLNALRHLAKTHRESEDSDDSKSQEVAGKNNASETAVRLSTKSHINLFEDLDSGSCKTNKDRQREEVEEREKYEKQIGYLTYLGQDTNEATGKQSWYNEIPQRIQNAKLVDSSLMVAQTEKQKKCKDREDPLNIIKLHCPSDEIKRSHRNIGVDKKYESPIGKSKVYRDKSKKMKKHKKSTKDREEKNKKLEELRKKRLDREKMEREREKKLISRLCGHSEDKNSKEESKASSSHKQMYNSQFNPHIAKQNYR